MSALTWFCGAALLGWGAVSVTVGRAMTRWFVFFLLIASVVAIAIKVVGVLLITSLLIIPAVTARRFSTSPEQMAIGASLIAVISVIGGLYGSLKLDTPSGPSIVVAAFCLFILSVLPIWKILHLSKISNKGIKG